MIQLNWIETKEELWIQKWDEIQLESPLGMFTQCSSWLNSYQAYGFQPKYLLAVDQGQIRAGFAFLLVKIGPFTMVNCTWGPYTDGTISLNDCLKEIYSWAKTRGALAVQVNLAKGFWNPESVGIISGMGFLAGNVMSKIFSPSLFNWISLPNHEDPEADRILLKSFSENARRNIKAALKNDLQVEKVDTPEALRQAYACFESNAAREGYPIRDWEDLKISLNQAMEKGQALFYLVKMENQVLGAIWSAKGGQAYHYIMGGVERTEKDLKIGHLLQWTVMQASLQEGLKKYNISVGGSEGVVRFKSSFYPVEEQSVGAFHAILIPWKYQLFKKGFKFAEKNKKLASKLLKLIR